MELRLLMAKNLAITFDATTNDDELLSAAEFWGHQISPLFQDSKSLSAGSFPTFHSCVGSGIIHSLFTALAEREDEKEPKSGCGMVRLKSVESREDLCYRIYFGYERWENGNSC